MLRALPVRTRRRTAVLAAAVLAGVLVVVLITAWPGGSGGDTTTVDGNTSAVLYNAGHRPVAPGFTGTTLTGSTLSLSSYRDHVVVLNFWGSWCVPCREEATTLAAVADKYRPAGVSFLGVDVRDTTASAQAFVSQFHVGYPSVGDASSAITADFTAQFKSFYSGGNGGSSFLMRVSFPVTGTQTQVATVQATLTNSAGQALTGPLTFQ